MHVVSMKPSVWRTAGTLLLTTAACMAALGFTATGTYFWVATGALFGVVALSFGFTWFMFVPVRLEFDRVDLTIRYWLGRSRTIPWFELEYYGPAKNVFILQFENQSFQIFPKAFAPRDWNQLISFLKTRFPECEADGALGSILFRWRKKQG